MNFINIIKKIKKYLKKEDRRDIEFRALITLTQIGDTIKYLTHDTKLNPHARPYGSKNDEKLAYGQAIVQLFATMILRKIDIAESIKIGLENWKEADWKNKTKREKNNDILQGISVFPGDTVGKAYVLSDKHQIFDMPTDSIVVTNIIYPGNLEYLQKAAAIVTDQGTHLSHAAMISKEYKIPCIVGTGHATEKIKHGQKIKLTFKKNKKGLIELL